MALRNESEDDNEKSFRDLKINSGFFGEFLNERSIVKPTPIQSATIPLIQGMKDVVVRAKTGSGKTLAYLIGLFYFFFSSFERRSWIPAPSLIIILPTLELAQQVFAEMKHLMKEICMPKRGPKVFLLKSSIFSPELRDLIGDVPDVIVSTLRCLLSCLEQRFLTDIGSLRFLVVDEVDQLLSSGFEDLKSLMAYVPEFCKRFLFSADPSSDVDRMKAFVPRNPYIVTLPEAGNVRVEINPINAEQFYILCDARHKLHHTFPLLHSMRRGKKVLIFVNSTATSSMLKFILDHEMALNSKWKSAVLDAELPDSSRLHVLEDFNADRITCLIAACVSLSKQKLDWEFGPFRGTVFKNLDKVIHYEMPQTALEYVRRIEFSGTHNPVVSHSLISPEDVSVFQEIKFLLKEDRTVDARIFVPYTVTSGAVEHNEHGVQLWLKEFERHEREKHGDSGTSRTR